MRYFTSKSLTLLILATNLLSILGQDSANYPQLYGVGFFEQTTTTGLYWLSMAGGAEIMVYGMKTDPTAAFNYLTFTSTLFGGTFDGPDLSDANVFKSAGGDGKIQYTMPSISTLMNVTDDEVASYEVLQYVLGLYVDEGYGTLDSLACGSWWNCVTQYNRAYTPILYGVYPPVSYYGANISFYVDPKSSQDVRQSTDLPFNWASIGDSLINYEFFYDDTSVLYYNSKQQIQGEVGDVTPAYTNEPTIQFDVGFAQNMDVALNHCSVDGSTCYQVMSLASISEISASQGYTNGGQLLTIYGYGFISDNVTITIDGVSCAVQTIQTNEITCETQSKTSASTSGLYAGQNGLNMKVYNGTSGYSLTTMTTLSYYEQLALTAESFQDQGTYFGRVFTGYFKAPLTTSYRFYISCDDVCTTYLSSDNTAANKAAIANVTAWTSFRNYYAAPNQVSSWISLTAGDYYYFEIDHLQSAGSEHVSVAVEIEQSAVSSHPNSVKEVQRLQINPVNVRDESIITITNPDSGYFSVYFYTSATTSYGPYKVYASSTASQMQQAISSYYTTYQGASVSVQLVMTDANGNNVTSQSAATTNTYYISFLMATSSPTSTKITGISSGSNAIFMAQSPSMVQLSSIPLSGNFAIVCFNLDGSQNTTGDIAYNAYPDTIQQSIFTACPLYRNTFDIWDGPTYNYYVDGRDIFLRFTEIIGNVPQFEIQSGKTALEGNSISYSYTSPTPSSSNIFYEPIPFELLYTDQTEPQVLMTSGGLPVVCASLACDYTYFVAPGQITGYTYSSNTLTITGTSLTTSSVTISFAEQSCSITSITSTQIVCTIAGSLVSGTWKPLVTDDNGLIPYSSSVSNEIVAVSITSISPNTGLNKNGGNTLTITGTNFPASLDDGSVVTLVFSDSTVCTLLTTSSTAMTCQTGAFATFSAGHTLTLTTTINGKTDSSHTVGVSSTVAAATALSPSNYSPVLTTTLIMTISSDFTGSFTREDFSVYLVPTLSTLSQVAMNVMSANTTTNQLYIKYPGAWSDTYSLLVVSASYGTLDTTGLSFIAIGTITSFTPTVGSIYGGALLTITGYTFSTTITDNPVMVGDYDCDVITTDATTITCRTPLRPSPTTASDEVYVFLKESEEATCQFSTCLFSYTTANTPILTSTATNFDQTSNTYQMTFTGSGFDGTTSTVALYIDSYLQDTISVSSTTVVVSIIDMLDYTSSNIQLYLQSGTPSGYAALTSVVLTPALVSVTPNIGSPAGSVITANIQGVSNSTVGLSLVTGSGLSICRSVTIVSYGVVECVTIAQTLAGGTSVYVKVNSTTYACVNTNTAQCLYSTSTSMPTVSAVSISSDLTQITFTGTNFLTSGYTALAAYDGVSSTSATITSATSVTAIFSKGIPVSSSALIPTLFFNSSTSSVNGHFATNTQTLTNALTLTSSSSSAVICSFAGGCLLNINVIGLATSLANNKASVTVCNLPCVYSEASSTSSLAACTIPALSTVYSIDNYNITSSALLVGDTTFSSNSALTYALYDGVNTNGFSSSGSTCFFGMGFTQGFVGIVTQVKFFMNLFIKATYVGNLVFQGSSDNVTYTDIFTVGEEIHAGWNYYSYTEATQLTHRFYRFYSTVSGACNVGEFVLIGVEAINNNIDEYVCTAAITVNTTTSNLTAPVTYTSTLTPLLSLIYPRYGNVEGGTAITFTGSNFATNIDLYTIIIDNQTCTVTSATSTSVVCTTAPRPGLYPDTSLYFYISGQGLVATQGLLYRYVNLWSLEDTWGGDFLPCAGDSIWVPSGMHLLVDVSSTPVLDLVLVEGSLIFPPDDTNSSILVTFDATYIFVHEGYMEVGTEQFPYTSQLIITMHGNKYTPSIATFGVKCIAVMEGDLEMHGIPRNPTWTSLESTANIGDNTITLNTAVDWVAGELIVIASTGYDSYESELFSIVSVDNTNVNLPVITLNDTLLYQHYAGIQTFGTQTLEMRAEVGLLNRNVVFRGDPETTGQTQFGAHIMMHSSGDESLTGKIEYIELHDVGQAYQLGRYPIHFHMIGTVSNSYVRGNSIHNTYNRAVTMHAIQYLRVENNFAYNTMGHTFFIEDAVEQNNYVDGNLAILTKRSWSLLNTDQTPASFWITHPNNIFRNNHAAGADRYGFWFDLQVHSTGPSTDVNVCPINTQLGEFDNNQAHSNGRYGLRIFHGLVPRTYPCSDLTYDPTNATDPFWQNPIITAYFTNFVGWKNGDNGAIVEMVGDVRFINFKVADNLVAGIEFSNTGETADGMAQILNALVVGYSDNADNTTLTSPLYGIITPRTENFTVSGVSFYNFDSTQSMAALGSCSHCFHPAATDSGARTVTFANLSFDSSVGQRIKYQTPYRAIYYDTDGTLTDLGAKTWATPYWAHNNVSECTLNDAVFNGFICDNTVQVRRIAFDDYSPSIFLGMPINIMLYDDDIITPLNSTELADYLLDISIYSIAPFRPKTDPADGWAMPYVTNHKYKIHWGTGLDFTQMRFTLSSRWTETDKPINLVMNFTDVRAAVYVITDGVNITNNSLDATNTFNQQTGDNVIYNDTATRQIHVLVDGKNYSRNPVVMEGVRCIGPCLDSTNFTVIETSIRYWSNASSWDNDTVPVAGQDVEIEPGWNMILDVPVTPEINILTINGRLSFLEGADIQLNAHYIFVRAGELWIGNETNPYTGNANIVLYGEQANEYIVFSGTVEAGDKVIANTASIAMYGQPRDYISRLVQSANPGDTKIYVETGLDWVAGDKLGLAPTAMVYNDSDYAIITNYNNETGEVDLDRNLTGYHYGTAESTESTYKVDMRGEVLLLSRNILIQGQDVDSWGCNFVTSDFIEADGTYRAGNTILNNVEIYNCSQMDTEQAALRFDGSVASYSSITNSAIHHGLGWGVLTTQAANIYLSNNVVFDFINFGANINTCTNITFDGNYIANIHTRNFTAPNLIDPRAGMAICGFVKDDVCSDITVINNVIAGTSFFGVIAPGHDCDDESDTSFKNNIVHSVSGTGVAIFPIPNNAAHAYCYEGSYVTVYKCTQGGVFTFYTTNNVQLNNLIVIDNAQSILSQIGIENDTLSITVKDSYVYGESEATDCPYENYCDSNAAADYCVEKYGAQIPYYCNEGVAIFPTSADDLPISSIHSYSSWGGVSLFENVEFINFKTNKTYCGMRQAAIGANQDGPDYDATLQISKCTFNNVDQSAFIYLFSPPISWADIDDCGLFPCTGPLNILVKFDHTYFTGYHTPNDNQEEFQVVGYNPSAIDGVSGCKAYSQWNAYYCSNENLGVLLFESTDVDDQKRTFSPMIIRNNATGFVNTLNEFMDHFWDGFYTSQLRLSRFPTILETFQNYEIIYTGTPPNNQRFYLIADYGDTTLTIKYLNAGAFQVATYEGAVIPGNSFNDTAGYPSNITGTECGENRYVGVSNVLQFYMPYGCFLIISPLDAILGMVRMNWTLEGFYADGGTTAFVDRLASSLGIFASTIKVVSVYEGSVVVQFQITTATNSSSEIKSIQAALTKGIKNGHIWLGAPIIDAQYQGTTITYIVTANQTSNASKSTSQTSSSSSSKSKSSSQTITISNGTIVISGSNSLNATISESHTGSNSSESSNILDPQNFLNTTKIVSIAVVLGVFLIALVVLALCLYRRSKKHQYTKKPQEDVMSPDKVKKKKHFDNDNVIHASDDKSSDIYGQGDSMKHNIDIVVSDIDENISRNAPQDHDGISRSAVFMEHSTNQFNTYTPMNPLKDTTQFQQSIRDNKNLLESQRQAKVYPESFLKGKANILNTEGDASTIRQFMPPVLNTAGESVDKSPLTIKKKTDQALSWYNIKEEENKNESSMIEHQVEGNANDWK